ncbi:MAG: SDR family oxidoreductase, partial [Anaerolineaceae bacterium]
MMNKPDRQTPPFEPGSRMALVTGSGRRLGREIALRLARLGYAIAIHYHASDEDAAQTRREIQEHGGTAHLFQADLTDPRQIDTLFEQIDQVELPLSVLVNSASVMLKGGLDGFDTTAWDITMNLNLRAVWRCGQMAFQRMQGGGSIINISDSGAGRMWTGYAAYSISKAGLDVLTRLMAKTYAPAVRVNAVAPGLILPPDDFP